MKKIIVLLMVLAMLAGCSGPAGTSSPASTPAAPSTAPAPSDPAPAPAGDQKLVIGTGSTGGTDNVVLEAIASVVNKHTGITCSTITTTGGPEITLLSVSGDVSGGNNSTIDLYNAANAGGSFEEAVDTKNILQGFGFCTWALPVIVLEDSPIQSYADLKGKTLGFPPAASSSASVGYLWLEELGLTNDVKLEYYTWSEGCTALKDGRIDAFMGSYANGKAISGIIEIEATKGVRCLSMDETALQNVYDKTGGGVGIAALTTENNATIPQGTTVNAPANSGVIIFNGDIPEETVYTYVKCVLDNLEELRGISQYFDGFEKYAVAVCAENIPFHPGAAKALKEAGLWEDRFTVYGG